MAAMTGRRPDLLDLLDGNRAGAALTDSERTISCAELARNVRARAHAMRQYGVVRGDRVVVMAPNTIATVEWYLACALIGAVWVGANPAAPQAERDRQCRLVAPRLVVADDLRTGTRPPEGFEESTLDTPSAIAFTSGTTAAPKAVVHTRAAVSLAAAALAHRRIRPDDTVGVVLPLSIHNLMMVGVIATLFGGARVVLVSAMNARGVAEAVQRQRLTLVNALVPATIYDMVHDDEIGADALTTLRYAGTGAAGLSEDLRGAFEAKFGVMLRGSYGMTEAPGPVAVEDPQRPHRSGSSGTSLPHVRVEAEAGQLTVAAATTGPFAGMFRPPHGTWTEQGLQRWPDTRRLCTGDRGHVAVDGSVLVSGRGAGVIVRGGVTVDAGELEAVLSTLPGVRELVVIGQDDDRLGERIIAFVEFAPAGGPDQETWLRQQAETLLTHGKVPDRFVVVDALPRNAMGKVERPLLTALMPT
jgi:malonyl-CoA/methylmalonyl-CoA synthetase